MNKYSWPGKENWPNWQRVIFRFFFIYFLLYIAPWTWIEFIPGGNYLTKYYYQFMDWCVEAANAGLFHVRKELVYPNGSGDTSYNWVQLWFLLSVSGIGTITWSLFNNKHSNYNFPAYWLRIVIRYFVIINCFGYGLIKIFCLQMPFPSLSQLATPLGDYLPMRFSWMFMGYSTHYQMFSGVMEVLAGVFLLFRRTATFGTLMALGVFINITMLNLSFDIPVKLFSMHLVLLCMVLLAFEYKRLLAFFIKNTPTGTGNLYEVSYEKKWQRISKWILKLAFIIIIAILPIKDNWDRYKMVNNQPDNLSIREGVYNVQQFIMNSDTLAFNNADTLQWKDIIFERNGTGSINSADTIFRRRYGRGYFNYAADTINRTVLFSKRSLTGEKDSLFQLQYEIPDSTSVILKGLLRTDSVYVVLKRTKRHFQLAERQFHWLSEYNR